MKICLAQTRPVTGAVEQNIARHEVFIETAVSHQADLIIFSELSLTGYEPTLADSLAIQPDDPQLDVFQTMANERQITIGVGLPTPSQPRPCISLVIFQPHQPRTVYTKQYLHADEEPFFIPGPHAAGLIGADETIALAICYELAVPDHAATAFENGANIYLASVAKFANGVRQAKDRLAEIARQYKMTVLLVNAVGPADGGECAGQTAVWNQAGNLVAQLDNTSEGILIFNTQTQEHHTEVL